MTLDLFDVSFLVTVQQVDSVQNKAIDLVKVVSVDKLKTIQVDLV